MEPRPHEQSDMELLETSPPPGRFERLIEAAARSRGARVAAVVATAVVAGAGLSVWLASDYPPAEAGPKPEAPATTAPRALTPPPWVTAGRTGWEVIGSPRVRRNDRAQVVTFTALNRSQSARRPVGLFVIGSFVGQPGVRFSADCVGFDFKEDGALLPVRSAVQPGEKFFLRCSDDSGNARGVTELDVESLEVRGTQG
jgi:hypothetical protein